MTSLDIIKSKIQKLYKTNPNIHINVPITHPKVNLKNEPVVIELLIRFDIFLIYREFESFYFSLSLLS